AEARKRVLAADGPLLIVNGDTAALLRGGRRSDAQINVPRYHLEKAIAHIPLAIYVALTPGEGELDGVRMETLHNLRKLIPPARGSLDGLGLGATVMERQDRITRESLAFLDRTIDRKSYRQRELETFTRQMAPLVMENVADAAHAQLDIIHSCVSA